MSIFDELDSVGSEKYDRKFSDRELFIKILPYFKSLKGRLISISILVSLISLLAAFQPVVVSRGVDLIRKEPTTRGILLLSFGVMAIGIGIWCVNWLNRRLMTRTVADVAIALAFDAFESAIGHDMSFHDEYSSGKTVSRITSDTRDFGQLVGIITDMASQILEAGVLGVVLVRIDWRLSLYVFAIVPFVFLMAMGFRKLARKVTKEGMAAMSNVNATIKETISGISVAKNFRQEKSIFHDFLQANNISYRLNVRRGLVLSIVFPVLNALGGIATAVLVYSGGLSVAQGIVTAGSWYLFLLSLDRFMYPVMNLASFWAQIQNGLSAAERIFALIDAKPVVRQLGDEEIDQLQGKIEFQDVSFHYQESEPVLDHFNLIIQPGENLAIVGHTGAGKSSIAKLIARFYEFQEGKILIDGKDIRNFRLESFRSRLGIVSQTPFLFSGSVAENIRYSNPEISDAGIEEIARQIGGGEWLDALPDGLNTEVGERGGFLSMGQRQLVSIMRVLVQQPTIFILDEATASIDPFTEWQIQQGLRMILERTTSLLIAHRLSTVKSADRIIVIEKGEIIEEGNHNFLMERRGKYSDLYNTFFRHQSLAYVEQSREFFKETAASQSL